MTKDRSGQNFEEPAARLLEQASPLLRRALCRGGTYADLFYECTAEHQLVLRQGSRQFRIGLPEVAERHHVEEGTGIRVLEGEHASYAAGSGHAASRLQEVAEEAASGMAGCGMAPGVVCPMPSDVALPALPPDAPGAVAPSEKKALLHAAAEAAFSLDERVRHVEVRYYDRVRRVLVVTSEGGAVSTALALLGLRVGVTLDLPEGPVTAYAVEGTAGGFGHFMKHPPELVAREAVARARRQEEARPVQAGRLPVVIEGGWGGVWLHEAVGHLLEADVVASGASPYAGRLGMQVAPSSLTLVDDAALPEGRGSAPFDDEGMAAGRTILIEEGKLRGFLTDRYHAARMDMPATGNGRRHSYRYAPLPRMTNLIMAPGPASPADLVAEVNEGLYVQMIGNGQVLPAEDRFSFDVLEGFRIERGRLARPAAGIRISGRISEGLSSIVGVGSDLQVESARGMCEKQGQVVPVSTGMPTVLIAEMEVGARAQRA